MTNPFSNDNSYGLVIGIGQRPSDSPAMHISLADAEHVSKALTGFCKLPKLKQLLGEEATCDRIKTELKTLADQTRQQKANLVIIYFSGHGCRLSGEYYLIGRETENDRIPETALTGKEFVAMIQAIQTNKMLVLLDCCHAGGMVEQEEIPFERLPVLESVNRVVITAGHKSQISYLSKPVSIFTYALIEGLGGLHFLDGDKGVTVFDLAMYIRERVVTLTQQVLQIQESQKPQLHVLENQQTTNFLVMRYANGQARKLFFEEDFSACNVSGKTVNPVVNNIEDKVYREKFNWLNVTIVGDGNYLFTDVKNSTITINNGISIADLKDLLREHQPVTRKLVNILKSQPDPSDSELLEKIELVDIELMVEDARVSSVQSGIDLFIHKLKNHTPRSKTYNFMINLKSSLNTFNDRELLGLNTKGELESIINRFINIITDYNQRFQ